jgi:hypothetical protein
VYVSLASGEQSTTLLEGLVDTGADAILASDLPMLQPATLRLI